MDGHSNHPSLIVIGGGARPASGVIDSALAPEACQQDLGDLGLESGKRCKCLIDKTLH
jgi:hypothetical protein